MIKNFFNVAGADAVKRIAEWIRHKFYTKTEIDDMLSAGMRYEVVEELPATGVEGTIYLVPSSTSLSGDIYDEYIYVDGDFEKIGTTKADLANVVKVPTAGTAVGDTTHHVYVDADGEATAGSQYAGGTKLTLNGTDKGADSATAYAPTAGGTAGQYLKSNGSGNAPSWETMDTAPTANSTKAVTSGGVKTALDGKQASISINTNANTPTDNDTVIMQDNGNTGTTSFLRRKLSTLWTYIKGKDGYPEARLAWGGKHLTNATSPVDAALIPDLSANRAAFINPDCVDILYSEDGGTTWQDYGLTDWDKQRLLCDERSVIVGKRSSSQHADAQCMLRILIHDTTSYFYAKIQKIAVYCATNGSEGCYCNVTGRKQVDINNNVDSWDTLADHVSMSGWSGWNVIQTSFITYGGNTTAYHINTYYGQIRLDFGISGATTADNGAGLSISRIRMYGTECWGESMSFLAKYGNPFVLREGKKCVFEGPIAIKDGTASQVLLANGDVMGLPVTINKGGTGATTAIGAEYNILNQVADISTTLSDTRKIALCNQTKSASNGVFRWIALSNVWTWIKTHFDSSPTSGSSNGITSGGVYSALEEKVNLQPDFTASQIDYSAGNVGKWQKVLRFPEGADLVINMKKAAMGSDSTSTLWFLSSSMGDSYTSLFGNHSVRFVHDGGYVFLVLACRKSTYEPIESYTFQIAHSSVPMSDIVAVTDASPITATPKEPSIVYRAPITTGAVSFNVTNGAGSVAMANHNDFLGNMTSEATNGVTVTMSGATEGQIYRFVFTRNITGGVTFKQSNVAYCTISGDVNAGDTITLTAVSNTAGGWLYEQESAGIESSDGSNIVEYNGSTADVRVNWEKLPKNIVRNNAYSDTNAHRDLAIGDGALAPSYSVAIGHNANGGTGSYGTTVGKDAKSAGSYTCAVGYLAKANNNYAIAIGMQSESNNAESIAVGANAVVCKKEVDANDNVKYRRFQAMNLQSFTVDGEKRKFYKPATAGDVTITFSGGQTATVNVTNGTLFVVNDSYAVNITSIFNGIMIDGRYYDTMDGTINLHTFTVTPISGLNAWAIDIKMPLAYIDTSEVNNAQLLTEILSAYSAEGCAFGSFAKSYGGYALGRGAVTTFPRQTVVGQYNVPSDSDYFQVGYGNGDMQRRNILTIDSNERLNVSAYVGGTQTIDMNQQTGSLGNITKAVYRIRWDDTGTVNLTLNTGGCVEGQRVTIFAETNDVQIRFTSFLIPEGRFADFMFIAGAWRPYSGISEVPTA